jgi:hypothetical protein
MNSKRRAPSRSPSASPPDALERSPPLPTPAQAAARLFLRRGHGATAPPRGPAGIDAAPPLAAPGIEDAPTSALLGVIARRLVPAEPLVRAWGTSCYP